MKEQGFKWEYVDPDYMNWSVEDYYERIDYADILWLKADEDSCVFFLTGDRSMYVNHYLGRVEQFLSDHPEFVRINRSEIINVSHVTRFIGNMYFIDGQELVATGIYRDRMHGIFRLLERKK